MKLPVTPGAPASDAATALAAATEACRAISTMTVEAAVRGSVAGQRTRATLFAGLASPASVRLEAIAFGQRVFTFVGTGREATLLLEQDGRVLPRAPAGEVLEALTGIPLEPADLKAAMTGCGEVAGAVTGERLDTNWRRITRGTTVYYLRRPHEASPWQLVAVQRRDGDLAWRIEYRNIVGGLPREVRFASDDRKRFDLQLRMSEIEINPSLAPDAFEVNIRPVLQPITLEELRRGGPFGGITSK
jgi:hypothetical protein